MFPFCLLLVVLYFLLFHLLQTVHGFSDTNFFLVLDYLTVIVVQPPQHAILVYVFTVKFVQVLPLPLLGKMIGNRKTEHPTANDKNLQVP